MHLPRSLVRRHFEWHLLTTALVTAIGLFPVNCAKYLFADDRIAENARRQIEIADEIPGVRVKWNWFARDGRKLPLGIDAADVNEKAALAIANVPGIRELELSGTVDFEACRILSQIGNVEVLRIREGCTVSDAGARLLCSISSLKSLEIESFSPDDAFVAEVLVGRNLETLGMRSERITSTCFATLARNDRLRHLILMKDGCPDRLLEPLCLFRRVESIEFRECAFRSYGKPQIDALKDLSSLRRLLLLSCRCDAGSLLGLSQLKQVRQLLLLATPLSPSDTRAISELKDLSSLSVVTPLTSVDLENIAKLPSLSTLRLSSSLVGLDTTPFRACRSLRELDLSYSQVDDAQLSDFAKNKSLKALVIRDCTRVTDKGLLKLRGMAELNIFDARAATLTDASAPFFSRCQNLADVNLNETKVGNAVLRELCKSQKLQSLGLCGTLVTDAGLMQFADSCKFRGLYLQNCEHITGECLSLLSRMPSLEILCLGGNPSIDDSDFTSLVGFRGLRDLNIDDTRASADSLKSLAALPMLRELSALNCGWSKSTVRAEVYVHPELEIISN